MRQKTSFIALLTLVLGVLTSGPATASHAPESLGYLVGTDFLCGLDPSACPAIARAPNGDTIEITGAGGITTHGKSATGGGTFVHKAPDGSTVAEGVWEATDLMSFQSYGSGAAQGLPEEFWGGRAILRVHLSVPGVGIEAPGVLWVDCLLGDKIPAGAAEGVRLLVAPGPFGGLNFNEEVSGFTVFIAD